MATGITREQLNRLLTLEQEPQQPVEQPKRKGGLLSVLPSAAAALASFVPGIGTAAAAGLGGTGELLRQKFSGEELDFGRAGKEAALSAIPGGIGLAVKGARAAKAAKTGATVAKEATAGGTASGVLSRFSDRMASKVRGTTPGAKATGQEQLGVAGSRDLNAHLDSRGIKGKNAREQLALLEQDQARLGKQIGETVEGANRPFKPAELVNLQQRIQAEVGKVAGLPKTGSTAALLGADGQALVRTGGGLPDNAYAKALAADVEGVTDLKSANDLRKRLDADAINYGRNSNSPDPMREQIAKAYRHALDNSVSTAIPELKGVQQLYGKGASAEDFLKNSAKNPKGMTLPFGAATVPGEVVQAGQAKLGEAATGLAGILQKAAPFGNYGVQLAAQGATRGVAGMVDGSEPDAATAGAATEPTAPDGLTTEAVTPEAEMSGSYFSPEALQALAIDDIQKTGGKNLGQIKTLKDMFGDEAKAAGGGKVGAQARKEANAAKSAMRSLNDIKGLLENDSSQPLKGAIGSLGGSFGRNITGSTKFETATTNAIDALIRLRTGAAATKDEIKALRGQLPQAGDSRESQLYKMQRFEQLLQDAISAGSGVADDSLVTAGGL